VVLSDPLPTGVAWAIDAANSSTGFSISNGHLNYGPGDLAAGASVHVHITGVTDAADIGTLTNTATITVANEMADDLDNNQSTASIVVIGSDVRITKVADKSPINAGDQAGFVITVSNAGAGSAYN